MAVVAPTGYLLANVSYATSGAIASQTWTTSTAAYTPTTGVTHASPLGKPSDGWRWWWDEHPGARTVTIAATYTTGASFQDVETFDVAAPTVSIVAGATKPTVGTNPISAAQGFGLWSKAQFGAIVDNVPEPNTVGGFVQLINVQATIQSSTQTSATRIDVRFPAGLMALDVDPSKPAPWYNQYSALLATPGPTNLGILASTSNGVLAQDAPGVKLLASNPLLAGKPTAFASINYTIKTYVVYRPISGLFVALGEFDWTIQAAAQWNGKAPYNSPANWMVLSSTVTQTIKNNAYQLLTWSMNASAANGAYSSGGPLTGLVFGTLGFASPTGGRPSAFVTVGRSVERLRRLGAAV